MHHAFANIELHPCACRELVSRVAGSRHGRCNKQRGFFISKFGFNSRRPFYRRGKIGTCLDVLLESRREDRHTGQIVGLQERGGAGWAGRRGNAHPLAREVHHGPHQRGGRRDETHINTCALGHLARIHSHARCCGEYVPLFHRKDKKRDATQLLPAQTSEHLDYSKVDTVGLLYKYVNFGEQRV